MDTCSPIHCNFSGSRNGAGLHLASLNSHYEMRQNSNLFLITAWAAMGGFHLAPIIFLHHFCLSHLGVCIYEPRWRVVATSHSFMLFGNTVGWDVHGVENNREAADEFAES